MKIKPISNLWINQDYNDEDVAEAFQNFIICIEMLLFAIAHYFVFSHKPFVDQAAAQAPCIHSCLRMLDVRDVADDMKEHFVDPISRPSFEKIRRRFGDKSDSAASGAESENDPLLKASVSSSSSVVENGRASSVGINDGSLSFSVLTYEGMTVQQRSQRSQRSSLKTVVEEEREGTTSSDSVGNDDEDKSTTHSSAGST